MQNNYVTSFNKKLMEPVLVHQLLRNKAIKKNPFSGFTYDLVIDYENKLKQQSTIDVTEMLIKDMVLNQMKMRKVELDVLLDAANDPNISLDLKKELFKRAYKIYEELGLKGNS